MIPNSDIWLCRNTKLRPGSEDTYYFASENARRNFFSGKSSQSNPQLYFTDTQYIRTDKYVQLPVSYLDAAYCDYCMFMNTASDDKMFYAFITAVEYINDNTTRIYYEIDPLQTWLPSLSLASGQCIKRETVLNDTYGTNLLDEGMSGGDMYAYKTAGILSDSSVTANAFGNYTVIAVKRICVPGYANVYPGGSDPQPTPVPTPTPQPGQSSIFTENIALSPTNTGYIVKKNNFWGTDGDIQVTIYEAPLLPKQHGMSSLFYAAFKNSATTADDIAKFLRLYSGDVHLNDHTTALSNDTLLLTSDDVAGIFSAPNIAFDTAQRTAWVQSSSRICIAGGVGFLTGSQTIVTGGDVSLTEWSDGTPTTHMTTISPDRTYASSMFDGYQPKNNKCLQSPFVQITIDNQNGQNESFKPELFVNAHVYTNGLINSTSAEVYHMVQGYNNEDQFLHVITSAGYPTYPWNTNSFSEWYGLHGAALEHEMTKTALGGIAGAIAAAGTGSVTGLVGSVSSMGASMYRQAQEYTDQQGKSPVSHGNASGNLLLRARERDYAMLIYSCSHNDTVRAADIYFTKYGYRVDRIGSINFTGRSRFNFVQTSGLQGSGNIPCDARDRITALFENGLRFWHGDYLGDYSAANNII